MSYNIYQPHIQYISRAKAMECFSVYGKWVLPMFVRFYMGLNWPITLAGV